MSKSNSSRSPLPHGSHFPQKLRQRLSEDLLLTGKSKRTHDAYLRAVRQLSDFSQCSPEDVTETQVRQFFLHLKVDRGFAYGSLRVAFSGVKFFFAHTCKRDWEILKMMRLQNITTLPEVLTIRKSTCTSLLSTSKQVWQVNKEEVPGRGASERRRSEAKSMNKASWHQTS